MSLIETLIATLIFSSIFVALLRSENASLSTINKIQKQFREVMGRPHQTQQCRMVSISTDSSVLECRVIELQPQTILISN